MRINTKISKNIQHITGWTAAELAKACGHRLLWKHLSTFNEKNKASEGATVATDKDPDLAATAEKAPDASVKNKTKPLRSKAFYRLPQRHSFREQGMHS